MDILNINRKGFSRELLRKVFRMKVQIIVSNASEYFELCDYLKSNDLIESKFEDEIETLNPFKNDAKKIGVSLSTYGVKNFGTKRRIKVQEINLDDYELWINFKYFKDKVIDINKKHGWE